MIGFQNVGIRWHEEDRNADVERNLTAKET